MKIKTVTLNNGVEIPVIGLGTFQVRKLNLFSWIAVRMGYRLFDTSPAYNNEKRLGTGLKFAARRKNIFITDKLSNSGQRAGNVRSELMKSLAALKTSYIDLYLIHWPVPELYLESWKQMEELYREGLVRAIGVCNCHQHHLEKLLEIADIVPAVNQIELHPLLSQKPLANYCRENRIAIEAYSPLARMDRALMENLELKGIATKHNKTLPQIVLRWIYQSGYISIPKTSSLGRLKQNIDIFDFELSDNEMSQVDGLNRNYRVRHDPDNCDFSKL